MADVLMISKPVAPPWNDSSKNLVWQLASEMTRHVPWIMSHEGSGATLPRGHVLNVYPPQAHHYAPRAIDLARVLTRLVTDRQSSVWHFFFAPNPRTSWAGRVMSGIRRRATVQTVCSTPKSDEDIDRLLFADCTVVLSRFTEARFLEAHPSTRIVRIPPAIQALLPLENAQRNALRTELGFPIDAALIVYPGDVEFSSAAELSIRALRELPLTLSPVLIMACRTKTAAAKQHEEHLKDLAMRLGLSAQVMWLGETRRIHDVLAVCDVVILPASTLYAKMDYPLVLLEAMSLKRPIIVARSTPAEELALNSAGVAIDPTVESLAHAIGALLESEEHRTLLGNAARERVIQDYNPARMAEAYEAVYDEFA